MNLQQYIREKQDELQMFLTEDDGTANDWLANVIEEVHLALKERLVEEILRALEGVKEKPRDVTNRFVDGSISNFDGVAYHFNEGITRAQEVVNRLIN